MQLSFRNRRFQYPGFDKDHWETSSPLSLENFFLFHFEKVEGLIGINKAFLLILVLLV